MPQENTIDITTSVIEVGEVKGCEEGTIGDGVVGGQSCEKEAKEVRVVEAQKKRRRLKKVRISDALRHEGLDERELAKTLKGVIDRQIHVCSEDDADDKFLASTVMGCFRYFDDGPSGGGLGHSPVKLLHNVPRPSRTGKMRKKKAKGRKP